MKSLRASPRASSDARPGDRGAQLSEWPCYRNSFGALSPSDSAHASAGTSSVPCGQASSKRGLPTFATLEGLGALLMKLRTSHLNRLESRVFDVLIVGGGINGAVSAAALAAQGASVALIDRGDFAGFTSEQSSNLV